MEQVNLGSLPDGTGGDSIRVGFQKCNDNFTEVAEKLKTAGGTSAEELKQIKDAATALAERVEKLETTGGGAPAGELATLKQQLQQLQTKLTAAEQAASGAVSKATTAQQAAATAQQTATSAQQAASVAAQTANAAKQEAAAAKQAADGKADTNHTHTHNQISDWDSALTQTVAQALAAAMPAVKSETGYMKLPNGLIIQWGLASDNGDPKNFPIAFPNKALILVGSAKWGAASKETSINANIIDNARFTMINGNGYDNDTSPNYWLAIGY
ncbi:gp53-like domain-containing protein [Eikenella corrodens]|uniref:gp53-like domain-containing protein n=1 Tax=Eikenella corrodens TaxID=539 RepID=UPI00129AECE3|nr:hypothetical protein [Eikenella corrodens]